jgi:hypothetical protein
MPSSRTNRVRNRLIVVAVGISTGALLAGTAAALPAPQVKARAGYYTGHEADKPSPVPVTFTVSKNRKKVLNFSAEAEAKAGCTNHLTGFEAPTAPMLIGNAGRFTRSSTSYPQPGVRVTVTGRFTAPTTVTGHIAIRFTRVKGCNANRAFTAQRTAATAPAPSPT